jgi:hypothetical protein
MEWRLEPVYRQQLQVRTGVTAESLFRGIGKSSYITATTIVLTAMVRQ